MSGIYETTVNSGRLDMYIEQSARGDRDAFSELYRSASPAVYAYSLSLLKNSHDAEDILHDCFINIYQAAPSYQSMGKPMAWILTIARNLCMRKLQQQGRSADISPEDWKLFSDTHGELSPDDRITIQACIQKLSDQEREIILLHAVAGFKHREIAEFLRLPLATVLSKYSRASKKLRKILEKEGL